MTDSVGQNGEMASKNVAASIMSEIGLEVGDPAMEPLADACHRLLEGGITEAILHDVISELLSELQRTGSLNTLYEDVDSDEEDEEVDFKSTHLFNPRDDDAY